MNVGMAIMMGLPAFTAIKDAYQTLKISIAEYVLAQQVATAATTAQTISEGLNAAEKAEAAAADLAKAATNKTVTSAKVAEIAATYGLTSAQIAEIAATNGLTIATEGLSAALLASPLLPFVAALAGVGIAIGAVVFAVQQAEANFYRFDKAVEDAKEQTKAASGE